MEQDFKLIPFCLERAKTPTNPNGLEVITRAGEKAEIIHDHYRGIGGTSIIGVIQNNNIGDNEEPIYDRCYSYHANGHFKKEGEDTNDLFLKLPITKRRMTNQELAWWLREHQEEHREFTYDPTNQGDGLVHYEHVYNSLHANDEVDGFIKIRINGGEWKDPIFEEK